METAAITVQRHSSPQFDWELASRAPHRRLRGLVLSYQGYSETSAPAMRRLEVPFAGVPLLIGFGPPLQVIDAAGVSEAHDTFVAGLTDSWVIVESCGYSSGMQVNFSPIGARMFLGISMESITNRSVELEDLFGAKAVVVVERLRAAPDWEARFDLLDGLIAVRFEAASAPAAPVVWAWNKLQASGGNANIGSLADELGYSHKHLIARFRDEIGLPPKTLARVVRFDRAVQRMRCGGEIGSWTDIAGECGYFDQAHMIRDFREFAGTTPADFLARRLDNGSGISGE